MRWKGRRQSDNVEDRRGQSSGGGFGFPFPMGRTSGARRSRRQGGGMGIMGILLTMAVMFFFPTIGKILFGNGSPFSSGASTNGRLQIPMPGGRSGQVGRSNYQNKTAGKKASSDDMGKFLSVVLADTEDVWTAEFRKIGRTYRSPKLIIFTGRTRTGCGTGTSQMGPFYCPGDQNVYVDPAFYDELKNKFGASGDFAHAYVIAHEVGHHVQTLLGISKKVQRAKARSNKTRANAIQVRMELQADCLAGVWARQAHASKEMLQRGDIEEALNAASAIGDDKIQRRMQGYVKPHTFTHGSSAQRVRWFKQGFSTGKLQQCDTFGAARI